MFAALRGIHLHVSTPVLPRGDSQIRANRLILANRFRVPELNPFLRITLQGVKNCELQISGNSRESLERYELGIFLRIDSRESIRANRPDSRCESPGHLSFRIFFTFSSISGAGRGRRSTRRKREGHFLFGIERGGGFSEEGRRGGAHWGWECCGDWLGLNIFFGAEMCTKLWFPQNRAETKGQKLKGKIVSALFHTFSHFFTLFHTFSGECLTPLVLTPW